MSYQGKLNLTSNSPYANDVYFQHPEFGNPPPQPPSAFLLLEDGGHILLEDGGRLKLES